MLPLTRKKLQSHKDAKVCYFCGVWLFKKLFRDIIYRKFRDHCHCTGKYRGAGYCVCNLKINMPKDIPVVFQRDSTYDYHFIIKELVNEFEGQLECTRENREKYKTFSIPVKKEIIKTDKDGHETVGIISYKIKFIDSARFIASSLSNLVENLMEGIHKIKFKVCGCFLEYKHAKANFIIYKCLSCNKFYSKKLSNELNNKLNNTFKFSNNDINKFILLLRRAVCPYEYMDDWEKCNETTLRGKEEFYSNLNREDITDADYVHVKRFCKDFEIKKLGEYHDLYLRSDVLLLVDVFGNFRRMCLKIYELDHVKFISDSGLAWKAVLKKTEVK